MSGQSIGARELLEAHLRAPRPTEIENNTASGGQAQGRLSSGNTNDDDEDEELPTLFVNNTFYRHKIGEGFIRRQPSELAPAKPSYFNIDDKVTRNLNEAKTSARRAEYTVTVTNAFFASIARIEAGNMKNAMSLLKQVSNNLRATRDMLNDRMSFLNITADLGDTSKQKSFPNDIMRNEQLTSRVEGRGGFVKTRRYF